MIYTFRKLYWLKCSLAQSGVHCSIMNHAKTCALVGLSIFTTLVLQNLVYCHLLRTCRVRPSPTMSTESTTTPWSIMSTEITTSSTETIKRPVWHKVEANWLLPDNTTWDSRTHPCIRAAGASMFTREDITYIPSNMEERWTRSPHHKKICNSSTKSDKENYELWLKYSRTIFFPKRGLPVRRPTAEERQVLSSFKLSSGEERFIEPLTGFARHPGICQKKNIFDITYLITENHCERTGPRPKSLFYDLGCTNNYYKGHKGSMTHFDYSSGSFGGPSVPLFNTLYKDRCINFDEIYAWEALDQKDNLWWDAIPDKMRSIVHYFNIPVKEYKCPAPLQGHYPGKGSFLRLLQATAMPDDFVVVKVDIDGGPELEIVEAIAQRPELAELVDELFFEYHFHFDFPFGWPQTKDGRTVDTAMSLMYRLRQAGIRSHFWI